uniref:Uncharacterized protein n=1 Tax=Caenorhabditis japonica TaxID=281687 RepID=A0A8R1EW57_CAEJA
MFLTISTITIFCKRSRGRSVSPLGKAKPILRENRTAANNNNLDPASKLADQKPSEEQAAQTLQLRSNERLGTEKTCLNKNSKDMSSMSSDKSSQKPSNHSSSSPKEMVRNGSKQGRSKMKINSEKLEVMKTQSSSANLQESSSVGTATIEILNFMPKKRKVTKLSQKPDVTPPIQEEPTQRRSVKSKEQAELTPTAKE